MKKFKVHVQRTQVQSQVFYVKAESRDELDKKLEEIDFGNMDSLFDEGEVDSIDYEVASIEPCKEEGHTFADEDLQECLDNL